jgi:hypothetical protein
VSSAEPPLVRHWRLHVASFGDGTAGSRWAERLGPAWAEARDLLLHATAYDLGQLPEHVDREQLRGLLQEVLPGRLEGQEPYARDLPDLLEDFLLHVASEEGLTTSWEWSSAIAENRESYAMALRDPARQRLGHDRRFEPVRRRAPKVGRNDPCPCGSGRKLKHCCGRLG